MSRIAASVALVTVAALGLAAPVGAGEQPDQGREGRVLVIAAPALTWEDVRAESMPNLHRLLEGSVLANLSVRVDRLKTLPGSGYATVGSGTKAVAPAAVAGLAFGPEEPVGPGRADEAFARRTGEPLDGGVGHLRMASVAAANDGSLLGGTAGLLGDALAEAGIVAGVVGNADHARDYEDEQDRHREVALGLVDTSGRVPCGRVDSGLAADDPSAPFGLALDLSAALSAFDECWARGGVVMVEASDVRRALDYRSRATPAVRDELWRRALARSDLLVGELLTRVDLDRDTVLVVAPAAGFGAPRLTVFALHQPDVEAGLGESATTRQSGFVSIVDVAPTIAAVAGGDLDLAELDGRAVTRGGDGGATLAARIDRLVEADEAARFRDRMLTPTVAILIVMEVVVTALAILFGWRRRRLPGFLGVVALGLLCALPLTYWAALVPFQDLGAAAYFAFVFGGGLAAGALLMMMRSDPLRPLVVALAATLLTTSISVVVLGSRLQVSTVFGDSPIVAGRFSGVNNVTFAQLIVASILLGVACVHALGRTRGVRAMLVLFTLTLVVIGAPMWGADVGGVLAGLPALAVAATLLAGWRVRWRHVFVFGGLAIIVVVALGLADLARDASDRSHLGRFFERIGADGWDGFVTVIERKLDQNVRTLTRSAWRFILVPVIALTGFVAWKMPGQVSQLRERVPELRAGLIGIGVAAIGGYALNDSGIAVPGMMVAVLIPIAIYVLVSLQRTEHPPRRSDAPTDGERTPVAV